MAIEVIQFAKPHLWASLVAGGSLTVAQTYYFMGFALRGSGYYGMSNSPASEEISCTPTAGNQTIKIEWWQDGGSVTAYANAGGGQVTVTTSAAHGRSNGDTAYIRGTTNYDGTYTIANVAATTFEITVAWVADDGASKWFADIGYHSRAHGMGFKWDKFTMIDAGDGKPYQWQNLNDPAVAGGEFDGDYGHRRWTIEYYRRYHTGNSINFTQEATTSTWVNGYLYDSLAVGGSCHGRGFGILDIAWRKTKYPIDSLWTEFGGKLCIYCTGTGNTIRTLIDALKASGYDDMFLVGEGYYSWNVGLSATIVGSVFTDIGSTTELDDCTIDLIGGQFCARDWSDAGTMTMNRGKISSHGLSYYFWSYPTGTYNDTVFVHIGNGFTLDYLSAVNFSPVGYAASITHYLNTPSGFKVVGGYGINTFQWRYQRANASSHMQDFYIKDFYMQLINKGNNDYTGKMTDVEFENNGLQTYDVRSYWSYVTGAANKIMECINVSCDRADGKIIVRQEASAQTITDLWNMRFKVDLSILDEGGNPINGADINLSWSGGSDTDTSDASGIAEVTGLSYTINWDNTMGAGYGVTSAYKDLTLTVKKAGYQKYKSVFTMQEGKDLVIRLKHSNVCVDQEVMLS